MQYLIALEHNTYILKVNREMAMTEHERGYAQALYDQALRREARRCKKKMTLRRELKAMLAGRLPLPNPAYPGKSAVIIEPVWPYRR